MMVDINEQWLEQLGVKPARKTAYKKLLDKAEGELQMRVGSKLVEKMTDEQIDEFELIEDEDKQLAWLEKAYPGYVEVVKSEFKVMSQEIKDASDKQALINSWDA